MIEIRFHGRGGQGAWTATQLLAQAALLENKHVQSFPSFGPERAGAPMEAYVRLSEETIKVHSGIYHPDIVVVLDPTLIDAVNVTRGLEPGGKIIINSKETPEEVKKKLDASNNIEVWTVPATTISVEILGRDIPSTAMLGALIKASPLVKIESLLQVTCERFKGKIGEANKRLIKRAYEEARK
ncbi:MAG: 2-oxoacid:acceptor oxidoreductase family protein [Candidatus Odinarchaeia archaeon]